jgi:hypothetical protein
MGSLKPGATYIYESPDNGKTVYAREQGADSDTKVLIGYQYDLFNKDTADMLERMGRDLLWSEIFEEAKSNPALQKAIDRVILIHKLSKDYGKDRT